jgi:hypothetical protein
MMVVMHMRRIGALLCSIGAVAGVSTAAAVSLGASTALGSPDAQTSTTTTVTVPGNQQLTDTGIAVSAGESVSIIAAGSVSPGPGWPLVSPVGLKFDQGLGCGADQYTHVFPAPGLNCVGMTFKVGQTGVLFPTGTKTTFHAPVGGELYLGVNDDYVADNTGSWTATITTR